MASRIPPYGYTIFCDDVREEVGNKISFMGIYRGHLIAKGPLPITLPKLCMIMTYCESRETALRRSGNIIFNIFLPGDAEDVPSVALDFPFEEARNNALAQALPDQSDPDIESLVRIDVPCVVAPFVIQRAGILKIRAKFDNDVIKIGALRIDHVPEPSPN
jgi:hypothetical protein